MNSTTIDSRDFSLDFVKGLLVIVMVVYHIMNILSTASPQDFQYVRFVSGSFIFISGFIISTYYERKFCKDRINVSQRLILRGFKLLIIFTSLNMLIGLTGFGNPNKAQFNLQSIYENLIDIYWFGNANVAAFIILIPISYLLMIAPILLLFFHINKYLLIIPFLLIGLCFKNININSGIIELGMVGIIGFLVGIILIESNIKFYIKSKLLIISLLIIVISLMGYLDRNILSYSIGIMVVLKLFYDLSKICNLGKQNYRAIIIMLGQYSLICYIMQIVFLQGLFRVIAKQRYGLGYETIFIFVFTVVYLICLCLLIKHFRSKYQLIDKSYKLVFS